MVFTSIQSGHESDREDVVKDKSVFEEGEGADRRSAVHCNRRGTEDSDRCRRHWLVCIMRIHPSVKCYSLQSLQIFYISPTTRFQVSGVRFQRRKSAKNLFLARKCTLISRESHPRFAQKGQLLLITCNLLGYTIIETDNHILSPESALEKEYDLPNQPRAILRKKLLKVL